MPLFNATCNCDARQCYRCPYFMGLVIDGVVMCWLDIWRRKCVKEDEDKLF